MLNTNEAKFHIRLISFRWYQEGKNPSYESFIVADKFSNIIKTTDNAVNNYLYLIDKEKEGLKERMNLLDKRLMYGNLHRTYKKALQKALQKKSRSLRLIGILEEFTNLASENEDDSDEKLDENADNSDKENTDVFQLQNLKVRRGKGRPA